jgi:hypothetical protein
LAPPKPFKISLCKISATASHALWAVLVSMFFNWLMLQLTDIMSFPSRRAVAKLLRWNLFLKAGIFSCGGSGSFSAAQRQPCGRRISSSRMGRVGPPVGFPPRPHPRLTLNSADCQSPPRVVVVVVDVIAVVVVEVIIVVVDDDKLGGDSQPAELTVKTKHEWMGREPQGCRS